nr:immunoglobulin heavy chain junction region [Mus musculus]MBK4195004.1 immunoglobulin heavy chain junction region [Mus musculus]
CTRFPIYDGPNYYAMDYW